MGGGGGAFFFRDVHVVEFMSLYSHARWKLLSAIQVLFCFSTGFVQVTFLYR